MAREPGAASTRPFSRPPTIAHRTSASAGGRRGAAGALGRPAAGSCRRGRLGSDRQRLSRGLSSRERTRAAVAPLRLQFAAGARPRSSARLARALRLRGVAGVAFGARRTRGGRASPASAPRRPCGSRSTGTGFRSPGGARCAAGVAFRARRTARRPRFARPRPARRPRGRVPPGGLPFAIGLRRAARLALGARPVLHGRAPRLAAALASRRSGGGRAASHALARAIGLGAALRASPSARGARRGGLASPPSARPAAVGRDLRRGFRRAVGPRRASGVAFRARARARGAPAASSPLAHRGDRGPSGWPRPAPALRLRRSVFSLGASLRDALDCDRPALAVLGRAARDPLARRRGVGGVSAIPPAAPRRACASARASTAPAGRTAPSAAPLVALEARPARPGPAPAGRLGRSSSGGSTGGGAWSTIGASKSTPASLASLVAELIAQHAGAHLGDLAFRQIAEFERPERHADQPVHRQPEMLEHPLDLAVLAFAQAHGDPGVGALLAVELRLDAGVVDPVDRDALAQGARVAPARRPHGRAPGSGAASRSTAVRARARGRRRW